MELVAGKITPFIDKHFFQRNLARVDWRLGGDLSTQTEVSVVPQFQSAVIENRKFRECRKALDMNEFPS